MRGGGRGRRACVRVEAWLGACSGLVFVSVLVCPFRGLFACVLSWVEILCEAPGLITARGMRARVRPNPPPWALGLPCQPHQ